MSKAQRLPTAARSRPLTHGICPACLPTMRRGKKRSSVTSDRSRDTRSFVVKLGENAETLAACLKFDSQLDRLGERLGVYAFLKTTEDQTNSQYQRMLGRFENVATRAAEAASYIRPELLALPTKQNREAAGGQSTEALSPADRATGALQEAHARQAGRGTAGDAGRDGSGGQSRLSAIARCGHEVRLRHQREGREDRVEQRHLLAVADLAQTECATDGLPPVLRAVRRSRKHAGCDLERFDSEGCLLRPGSAISQCAGCGLVSRQCPAISLREPDRSCSSAHLPAVHHYYDVRRRKMRLKEIHHYDTYVPILSELETRRTWDQAVQLVLSALEPLGSRLLRRAGNGLATPLVRSVSQSGQAERRVQLRIV